MADEVATHVHVLREGNDASKTVAAWALGNLANSYANSVLIAEAGGIPLLVELLRDGSADAKFSIVGALSELAHFNGAVLIAEAGGIPLLVELLRDGSPDVAGCKLLTARVLGSLASNNEANKSAIAEAGGIAPLVDLRRNGPGHFGDEDAKLWAAWALRILASNNDANAVAIAVTVGLEALVELARDGDVTIGLHFRSRAPELVVRDAGIAAERKAALVVAALLRDYVPEFKSAPRDIKTVIASYL